MKYLSYQTLCDSVISHVTIRQNVVLAHCGNGSLSIGIQQLWLEAHYYGSFRNGH